MPILNYTTQVSSEKTIMEITKCLVAHGATKIVTDYKDGIPSGVTFCLVIKENLVAFALPANYDGVLNAMKKDKNVPQRLCVKEQALRVSWRIIKTWIEGQMAIVEAELVEVAEVFLPYAVTKSGSTLYQEIKNSGDLLMLNKEN